MKHRILKYGIPIIIGFCLGFLYLNLFNVISIFIFVICMILILILGLIILINYLFHRRIAHGALVLFIVPFSSFLFLRVSILIKDYYLMARAEKLIKYVEGVKSQSGNYPLQISDNLVEFDIEDLTYKLDEQNDRFLVSYDLTHWLFQTYRSENDTWVYWNSIEFATKSVLGMGYQTNINKR